MGLYRIVQEGLNNISRHAQASEARVELNITPEQIQLIIEDDGRGFDPTQVPPGRFGLVGLNERVKLLGGILGLESRSDAGTSIEVAIPLD